MNVSEWIGLAGLLLGVGGVAINIGVSKARIAAADRRIESLEAARGRMGEQLHDVSKAVAVIAALVHERTGGRRKTLARIAGTRSGGELAEREEGAPDVQHPDPSDSGES
jgi:hypothetical protein